jgi:hypothetical protein
MTFPYEWDSFAEGPFVLPELTNASTAIPTKKG